MKIIVSYRRSDSSATAGRIYDHLLHQFGQRSVFMDVDAIPFGTDFRTHIKEALLGSDILLAVIGPNWLGAQPDGSRRIDDEADPVRVEVETALANGVTIIPVLIDGAPMPGANQLPTPLKDLAFLNAAPVDMGRDFRQHADRLVRALETILAAKAGAETGRAPAPIPSAAPAGAAAGSSSRAAAMGIAALCLVAGLGAGGWFMFGGAGSRIAAPAVAPAPAAPAVVAEASKPVAAPEPRPAVSAPPPEPPRAAEPTPPAPAAPVAQPAVAAPRPSEAAPLPPPGTAHGRRVATIASAGRSKAHGAFSWYELWTTNAPAAQTFYRGVMGWGGSTTGSGAGAYTVLSAGPIPVSGLATLPASVVAQGVKPGWIGYVTVTDVDASVDQAKSLGGTLYLGPADIHGIGRYALMADPQGGVIALFKGIAEPPAATEVIPSGHAGWRELRTTDRAAASDYYGRLFGWQTRDSADGGASWPFGAGQGAIGAMRSQPAGAAWTFAFRVGDLTSAMVRVTAGGGRIVGQPRPLANDYWIVSCIDPQGASFALMSQNR